MDFYIQMGHGMQELSIDHMSAFSGGTIIISPLNIKETSLVGFSRRIKRQNGRILFDPQLYYPRRHHKNLSQYSYWPKTNITCLEKGQFDDTLEKLKVLNDAIMADRFILPSMTVSKIDKQWNAFQKSVIDSGKRKAEGYRFLHTIALSSDVLLRDDEVESIISYANEWDVEGMYIVCEHPKRFYLVDQPLWLSNLLSLVTGLKRIGKRVIVGYASHQMLLLAAAKCDAIASGNFLNVRWFQPSHFETQLSDETSRRSLWYYCPQALSEFKIPFLDIAKRMNVLEYLKPSPQMINENCDMLFSNAIPTSTAYCEKLAHRHYLYCLRKQCESMANLSYKETFFTQQIMLETADKLLTALRDKGIRGQDRDFGEIIDVNRAALAAHDSVFGFVLQKEWDNI